MWASTSRGILEIPYLAVFIGHPVTYGGMTRSIEGYIGWGAKRSGKHAEFLSKIRNRGCLLLEDGFLRSYGTGDRFPPLALVEDSLGIYYDSTRPSSLESLLESSVDLLAGIAKDVERARSLILASELSKYNHAPSLDEGFIKHLDRSKVLVVDQTWGDQSVILGNANADTFQFMLEAAKRENPHSDIYVKTHPEVSSGKKKGYLTAVKGDERTVVLRHPINPLSLIKQMDRVYVVTSHMGFEALLAGKKVSCFGMPYYAGWGVTDDRQTCPRRKRQRSVLEIFAAAYFHYTHYLNPKTHQRGTIFDVIEFLREQKNRADAQGGRTICVGFRQWRRANFEPLLSMHRERLEFVPNAHAAAKCEPGKNDHLVHWGRVVDESLLKLSQQTGARLLRMEDGFIRSVGLGSDLIRPSSVVLDGKGIYFDPGQPSDLEDLLNTATFAPAELERARMVREFIVDHGMTKYNLESTESARFETNGRPVIFAPGQVEDDASIRHGCGDIRTNLGLLRAARESNPDAFIVYKPHPDAMSMNRRGRMALSEALKYADHVETGLSAISCIKAADSVHTLTSLCGFDALLRDKQVVVYGLPFYSGWGLTEDKLNIPRRQRRLNLDELVAGALLRYPIYWDWKLNGFTDCESVLDLLFTQREEYKHSGELERLRNGFLRRQLRKLTVLVRSLGH